MPPVEAIATDDKKSVVGFIYPPPEVRNIVDKTANFVARNGPEFEARIRQNEQNNPKFNFLNPGDPYHAYYQHKVSECRSGKPAEKDFPSAPALPRPLQNQQLPQQQQQKQQELLRSAVQEVIVPKEPPPEFEFIADPPSISAFDLDVVRLTAQFVARNGRQFLTTLMNREQRNYQFDFLRPQHSLFQYFTRLLEQYTKVLIPPKDLMKRLSDEAQSPQAVMKQIKYRVEWEKHQAALKRKEEEEAEKERMEYAAIDWHDFSVVETIDYSPWESGTFPPPTTPQEVGKRVLIQERLEEGGPDNDMVLESDEEEEEEEDHDGLRASRDDTQVQDMEEESSEEEEEDEVEEKREEAEKMKPPPLPREPPQPPPAPPVPGQVVVKEYDPRQRKEQQKGVAQDQFLVSPITGERISADKVGKHMRIGMLDPRWLEDRDRQLQEKSNQENVYASGSSISSSLKQLAERRTDIFGAGDLETGIGKKIGEEEKREEKVTWDGHTASMEAATRAARANISINEQIHQIHKVKGLLPDEEKEKIGPQPKSNQPPARAPPPPQPPPKQQPPPPKPQPPPPPPKAVQPPQPAPPPKPSSAPQVVHSTPPVMTMPLPSPLPPMTPMMPPGSNMMVVPPVRGPVMVAPRPGFIPGSGPVAGFMPPQNPPQGAPGVGNMHGGNPMMEAANPGAPGTGPIGGKNPLEDGEDGPAAKRPRTEDSLVPEQEWARRFQGAIKFNVGVPVVADKPEWRLSGQTLTLTLPITDPISVVKARIHDETGLPPGKQKLVRDGLFFKDSNTLAFYNITPGSVIQLQLKERGGRKK
ncbi:splicing factor 3a subunit 1 [Oratosquilla oratoria]|uniref:splicing factor 3a subunit 1 n=1 Tax=Oratosquilla oratoria TaxID=337810 RepID=UPI003F75DD07